MPDVILVLDQDAFWWCCEKCAQENREVRSFIGQARCKHCKALAFITEVVK
jgi:hypothetical protein